MNYFVLFYMVINRKHKITELKKLVERIQKKSRILKMPDNKDACVKRNRIKEKRNIKLLQRKYRN